MAENTPKLAYLLDPLFQIENVNGKPLVGGYIEVYYAGTNEKYITYQNFDFTQNPFKIPLGSDGRAVVLAQTEQAYDVYVRDSFGNLVFSRLNIAPGGAGGVAFGMTKVSHDDTLTGNGTQLSPLGVSPLTNLAVDETMTAYEATVEGKDSLVLGVNGDWFNSAISGISNDFVTNETFSACCSAVKGGLDNKVDLSALNNYYTKTETWNTFLPRSGLDLSNYYTTAQTYNKYEIEDRLDGKQSKLTFGYDEYSAISSINNSALAGGQGGDTTPWISGAKILADTQTMTDNMIIQVLSSFTLSGNKNHCIAVKGGVYRFPNKWEIASGIAETNYFMPQSSMSGYLPTSSFTSYTASIASNLENNWNYTNSAYSLSINNFYNKLDASAFSAYTADAGETYTLVGGDNISISSDDEEKTTTISVTGEVGDTTPWISGAKILAETKYMEPGEYIQVLSSFTLSGNKNHCIAVKGGGYYFPTNYMLASGISSSLTGVFVPSSTFSSFVSSWSDHLSTLYSNDSYLSSCVSNISANKLDASSYHELTAGTNIDIQNYVISSKDWTNEIKEASANAFNEATAANPTSSTQWNSCYETVNTNSGEWNKVSAKLDTTAFESYTANDETYLLKGGYNIGVSSDDVNKETTIYYTGTNGDEQVNQVVRQYSAAGTWLTSHQDWTNTITAASAYAYSQATAQIPAPFDPTYISGQIDNKLNKSESANYYPMTGNPSGFLTAHQSLTGYYLKIETSSREEISAAINELSGKLPDIESVYTLTGGTGVELETDHVNQQTIINVTGQFDNTAVNNVVQTYSANGTWLTAHQSLTNYYTKSQTSGTSELSTEFAKYQPKGNYLVANDITGKLDKSIYSNASGNWENTYNVVNQYSAAGTWLTAHQNLDNYYTKTDTSSKQEIDTALQYISSNAGKTYTGDDPIYVNNETNHIGITGEALSAGPNIDLFESGGYVVISATGGGSTFPITGTNGTTGFTANMDCSSVLLTTGASPAGGYVRQTVRGVQYEAYPATDVSASWYNIINATNNRSNCYCIRFTNEMTAASLEDYSAYDKVTVVHSNEYTPDCMLYWDGNTKVFPSGLYCELVKGTNDQNQTDWFFTTSGWINNLEWDYD